jgi:Zn-dependent protease with chaperone function
MPIELPPGTASYSDDRTPPPQKRQLVLLFGFAFGFIAVIVLSFNSMVDLLVNLMPAGVEQQLGAIAVPTFEKMAQPSPTQDKLNTLLEQLESNLPNPQKRDYKVLYVPDETVNALAIPGDRVIIYQGLLDQMESENELMMVMGHELGHFAHRDHLRQLGRGLLIQILLVGITGDPGSLQAILVSGATTLTSAQFSQKQELQADELGIELLQKTYGHVAGATDFFARLSKEPNLEIPFLGSHPISQDRVQRLQEITKRNGWKMGERSPLVLPKSAKP